jgi:hypothetical protein
MKFETIWNHTQQTLFDEEAKTLTEKERKGDFKEKMKKESEFNTETATDELVTEKRSSLIKKGRGKLSIQLRIVEQEGRTREIENERMRKRRKSNSAADSRELTILLQSHKAASGKIYESQTLSKT